MSSALKILMASATPPDPDSGAAGTEYQTMLALRALGHEVDALWADALRHRIRHGNLHYLLELPWSYRDAIRDRLAKAQYDVIHVNQPYAWLAAREHQRVTRPGVFINRSHGWEPRISKSLAPWRKKFGVPDWRFPRGILGRPLRRILNQYARWAAEYSDGVIVSCSEDRDFIVAHYKVAASSVSCIPQASPPSFAQRPLAPMSADRSRRILYVGQSGFFKGAHVLAQVFSDLALQHADLEFTWCTPAIEHERCRTMLAVSIRDRVTFLDWMPQEALIDLYDRHGVFIFSTLSEGFGKVFLEAMSRGLCVVASDAAGMRDVIQDGENGHLVPVGDVKAFCERVERLQNDPDALKNMSTAAAATALQYSWPRVAEETLAFYEHVLQQKTEDK